MPVASNVSIAEKTKVRGITERNPSAVFQGKQSGLSVCVDELEEGMHAFLAWLGDDAGVDTDMIVHMQA